MRILGATGGPVSSTTGAFSTSLTTPKVYGGTGTTSTLTLIPTSGAGTTGADIVFAVGNNGGTEVGRFLNSGVLSTLAHTITSASATALAVGPAGTTSPSFVVDASTASAASGLKITSAASGSGVAIAAIGGTNEGLTLGAKGNGACALGTATGNVNINAATASSVNIQTNSGTRLSILQKNMTWTPSSRTSGATPPWVFTGGTDTSLTAGTEAPDFQIDLSQTKQHASNTTVALQRHVLINSPTNTFATNGGTITEAATLAVAGPPTCDANNTITQSEGIRVGTRALTGVTNGYGAVFTAPSGAATINAAVKIDGLAQFSGTNSTGGGSAVIGAANSPATTNTAVYTWLSALAADGSTVYIPCWK